jgi:hypothetical protein
MKVVSDLEQVGIELRNDLLPTDTVKPTTFFVQEQNPNREVIVVPVVPVIPVIAVTEVKMDSKPPVLDIEIKSRIVGLTPIEQYKISNGILSKRDSNE